MRILAILLVATLASAGCLSGFNGSRISAYDLVTDDYSDWVIEIDYTPGEKPSTEVLNAMLSRVRPVVDKDSVQTVISDGDLPSRSDPWTRGSLDKLHEQTQDRKTKGDTVVTHVMFVDGNYEEQNVLGIAVGHEYVAIFSDRISRACTATALCFPNDEVRVRQAVLIHEIGHIMGLVDNGLKMVRNHSDGGSHSSNQNSVMYASAETTGIFGLNNIPLDFDADDKADLCAASGKC